MIGKSVHDITNEYENSFRDDFDEITNFSWSDMLEIDSEELYAKGYIDVCGGEVYDVSAVEYCSIYNSAGVEILSFKPEMHGKTIDKICKAIFRNIPEFHDEILKIMYDKYLDDFERSV